MTTFWCIRKGNALYPSGDESIAAFQKLPFGKTFHAELKQPRNGAFLRLYWALCHRIADGVGVDAENISDMLKIATGHVTIVKSKTLGTIRLPKSISFAKMDEIDFRTFFDQCVQVIYTEWNIDRAAVDDLILPDKAA